MDELFTCEEVAERYKVKILTVWAWIRREKLPAIRIGKEYRVVLPDLLEFERSRRTTRYVELGR